MRGIFSVCRSVCLSVCLSGLCLCPPLVSVFFPPAGGMSSGLFCRPCGWDTTSSAASPTNDVHDGGHPPFPKRSSTFVISALFSLPFLSQLFSCASPTLWTLRCRVSLCLPSHGPSVSTFYERPAVVGIGAAGPRVWRGFYPFLLASALLIFLATVSPMRSHPFYSPSSYPTLWDRTRRTV